LFHSVATTVSHLYIKVIGKRHLTCLFARFR